MHSGDLLLWIINILDISKTGEINGNNAQIKYPNRKPDKSKLKDYSMRNGDTFARQQGIAPSRWLSVLKNVKHEEKKKVSGFDLMEQKFRNFRKQE